MEEAWNIPSHLHEPWHVERSGHHQTWRLSPGLGVGVIKEAWWFRAQSAILLCSEPLGMYRRVISFAAKHLWECLKGVG